MRNISAKLILPCSIGLFIFGWIHKNKNGTTAAPATFHHETVDYPQNYFLNPVDDQIKLTGTFGELRSDHFHSGIDIRSKTGNVGQPVFASAEGFVDRIRVQASGYGNVIYLKHPNGYMTVYAHLDRFSPELQAYVRENQYKKESFEVDLKPTDGQFTVKKGQEIGKLGNSGGSTGPHLHFEIRNTSSSKALNPLLFNLPVTDHTAPEIRDMKMYFLNENREVLGSKPLPLRRQKNGKFGLEHDTVKIGAWRVGFGVKTYDQITNFRNDNGVYAIQLLVDDATAFHWKMDELDFDETRYLNAHCDYAAHARFGSWFHRCFQLPGNRLANYQPTESNGAVALYKDKPVKITLKVSDPAGNTNTLSFWALRDDEHMEVFTSPSFQYEFPYANENRIAQNDLLLVLPKGALYETLRFFYTNFQDNETGIYSAVHQLHDEHTPVHRFFDLHIKPENLPDELRSKAVIANCSAGRPENCGGGVERPFFAYQSAQFWQVLHYGRHGAANYKAGCF